MLVGTFITDSNGVEHFVANDSAGYYLAQDAKIMVNYLKQTDVQEKWKRQREEHERQTDQLLTDSGESTCR